MYQNFFGVTVFANFLFFSVVVIFIIFARLFFLIHANSHAGFVEYLLLHCFFTASRFFVSSFSYLVSK